MAAAEVEVQMSGDDRRGGGRVPSPDLLPPPAGTLSPNLLLFFPQFVSRLLPASFLCSSLLPPLL